MQPQSLNIKSLTPFLPALKFVLRFALLYVLGNLLYGLFVSNYDPAPDPATSFVAKQTAQLLTLTVTPVTATNRTTVPNTGLTANNRNVLAIYEGCNGINVMIVFLAFMLAIGPWNKKLAIFVAAGLLVIHLMNLARIFGLFLVAVHLPDQFYFIHKYFFTAILYVAVFGMWFGWLRISGPRK